MAAPRWSSRVWTEQTLTRLIGSDQQQVEMRSNERMPQSFMVPRSLLHHYCPQLQRASAIPGQPVVLETTRPILTLFFNWLYTGKIVTADWHSITELYFLGTSIGSVALNRSAISQLQKVCRNDQADDTEIFHYAHICVIDEMVGTSSSLSRYIEDTYFNHWQPSDDDDVDDSPSDHPKSNSFFKKLFERSLREQREGENCSCCHDYCKYHDHESEEERLATCGHSAVPFAEVSADASAPVIKPDPVVRKASRRKAAVRESIDGELALGDNDSLPRETRSAISRAGTPRGKAAVETWLKVPSRAPVDFPADYHGLLTSLPQVKSIKAPDWLESGVYAEGVDQLPEPDRIIAAAMSWNAEDYAQTKCTFFDQYDPTIRNRHHWLNTLRFGGSKSKERAERLLATWECLGWLEGSDVAANDQMKRPNVSIASKPHLRTSYGGKLTWSREEKDATAKIMRDIETDESYTNLGPLERSKVCSERLEIQYGHCRTDRAVYHYWNRARTPPKAVAIQARAQADQGIQPVCDDTLASGDESVAEVKRKRGIAWTLQEDDTMLKIMDALEQDQAHPNTTIGERAETCKLRMKAQFGTDRTPVAIKQRYHKIRREEDTAQNTTDTIASTSKSVIVKSVPNIFKQSLVTTPLAKDSATKDASVSNAVASKDRIDSADPNPGDAINKRPERWTEIEDVALAEVLKEIEADSSLAAKSSLERYEACSRRLSSKHSIERTAYSVKKRKQRLNLSNDTSAKRKGDDSDDYKDEFEPLMSRQKRRQTMSRFVSELFDAEEG